MSLIEQITQKLIDRSRPYYLEMGCRSFRRLALSSSADQALKTFQAEIVQIDDEFFKKEDEIWAIDAPIALQVLETLFPRKLFYEQYAAVILPDHLFSLGSFSVPTVAIKTGIQPLLERELRQSGSLNFSDYEIRYELGNRSGNKLNLHFCAISRKLIGDILNLCSQARIVPVSIQPGFTGLVRQIKGLKNEIAHPIAVLNIGECATTAAIFKGGQLQQVTIIELGIADFRRRLVDDLGLNYEETENVLFKKLILLEDPSAEAQLEIPEYTILESVFAELLQKIYGFLLLYSNDHPDEAGFAKIILAGAGAGIRNFNRLISANLGIVANSLNEEETQESIVFHDENYNNASLAALAGHALAGYFRNDKFERTFVA